MVVEQDASVRDITKLVHTYIPKGHVSRNRGMELSYTLPLQDANRFPGKTSKNRNQCLKSLA